MMGWITRFLDWRLDRRCDARLRTYRRERRADVSGRNGCPHCDRVVRALRTTTARLAVSARFHARAGRFVAAWHCAAVATDLRAALSGQGNVGDVPAVRFSVRLERFVARYAGGGSAVRGEAGRILELLAVTQREPVS